MAVSKTTVSKTPAKKVTNQKAAASKKPQAKRNLNKGQSMECEVCGLAVTVDEIGGEVVEEESVLLCCGKPMKAKTASKKTAKK